MIIITEIRNQFIFTRLKCDFSYSSRVLKDTFGQPDKTRPRISIAVRMTTERIFSDLKRQYATLQHTILWDSTPSIAK